jgi:hypothetical protein
MNLEEKCMSKYGAGQMVQGGLALGKIHGTIQIGVCTAKNIIGRRGCAGQHGSLDIRECRHERGGRKLSLGTTVSIEHLPHESFVLALLGGSHGVGELGER